MEESSTLQSASKSKFEMATIPPRSRSCMEASKSKLKMARIPPRSRSCMEIKCHPTIVGLPNMLLFYINNYFVV